MYCTLSGAKLQELIFEGHTTIKLKGKSYRVKTPMCATLKKLKDCGLKAGGVERMGGEGVAGGGVGAATPLPQKITLVLTPRDNVAFARVHRGSFQNPRLTLTMGLEKRLSSVIAFLSR